MSSTSGKHWVTEPTETIEIDLSHLPDGDYGKKKPITIIEALKNTVEKFGDRPALEIKKSSEVDLLSIFP